MACSAALLVACTSASLAYRTDLQPLRSHPETFAWLARPDGSCVCSILTFVKLARVHPIEIKVIREHRRQPVAMVTMRTHVNRPVAFAAVHRRPVPREHTRLDENSICLCPIISPRCVSLASFVLQ
ncbi:unnamed protein product [Ectocarpus sp. 12 AP-2014]